MSEKNFVNFHVLISHNPSCLNRDDMNLQKTAIFGGERRVRISSQSLKRAMRKSTYYRKYLGHSSVRTRELGIYRNQISREMGSRFPTEIIDRAITFWADARGIEDFESSETAVAPWVVEETEILCEALVENDEFKRLCDEYVEITGNADKDKKKKRSLEKKSTALLKKEGVWDALLCAVSNAIDIALSGRMATSGLMTNIDGAMSIAHSITTHSTDSDIDWFSAVDDLVEQGAGHLNSQELSSGVFYRYASLNIPHLQQNLGGATRERALEIAKHVAHMLATVVPTAKNQSTAPFNLADFVMISFSDLPVSLANAFEKPIDDKGGYLRPSIEALTGYWKNIHRGYGLDEQVAAFQVGGADGEPETFASLPELEDWVAKDSGK